MTDSSTHDVSSDTPNNHETTAPEAMAELRSLLLGFDQSELEQLYERLRSPKIHPDDLSRMLPEAIILRTMQDKLLSEAIVPAVEDAIQSSVKKDLNVLSDSIFPVIAPASRKAITTALDATLDSFNQALEHSVSLQSFKWRLEALQTGKTFVEVVLLRTLLYQVEQVFLIHKETGLLLHHVLKEGAIAQDADLVSAMLTAIQNFVQESFKVQTGDSLETLQFGELTIWIEKGPQAVLAGVIRGHPPQELKLVSQDALEKIHLRFSTELKSFKGDISPYEGSKPYLETCLQAQYKKSKKQKHYPFVYLVITALLIALGTWAFFYIRNKHRWTDYLEKLNAEPGIVVTKAQKRNGKFFVLGLRDPLAKDPIAMLKEVNIAPEAVISQWKPFVSLDSEFVAARAKQLLQPPATLSLEVDKNGTVHARGTAPQQWILESRKVLRVIPGVTKFNEENLVPRELSKIQASRKQIEKQILLFEAGKIVLKPGQEKILQNLVKEINKLNKYTKVLDKDVRIQIIGHTHNTKEQQTNLILSKARASVVLSTLASKGIKTTNLSVVGVGSRQPLSKGFTAQEPEFNRSVSFKVMLNDNRNRETMRL
jgi:OOP family OmpA-OmpF porin